MPWAFDKEDAMPPDLAHKYQMALRTVLDSLVMALAASGSGPAHRGAGEHQSAG